MITTSWGVGKQKNSNFMIAYRVWDKECWDFETRKGKGERE